MENDFEITVSFNANELSSYTDEFIQSLWHTAQLNPAAHGDEKACKVVKDLLYEIARRWLASKTPSLYSHQPDAHYWRILATNGKWADGKWVPGEPAIKPNS